ncbi:MAG: hypothetical protein A2340_13265 [Lentisphaerae bacterium RIFOXYB12_FULL_60_10]|nr:MAG: hypothetical protein A2340_13265 [Lentisphaerae bacterium RIFOXYB12_FULL_60_10]
MLTRRERLRRCYFNEPVDRPAVYSRTAYPPNDPTYDRLRDYLQAHTELKRGWWGASPVPACPVETTTEPHSGDFDRQIDVLHTPGGDLRRTSLVSRKGQPGLHESYYINCREDAERYLSMPLPQIVTDPASFREADVAMGDAGIVEAGLGLNPGGSVVELCGSENFAMLSVTDRDILHALCERQMTLLLKRVKALIGAGVGPFFAMLGEEYIVPPLHGPEDFNDFNVRYDKPILDAIHHAGGRVHIHSHGSIKRVFAGFLEMGVDVLHPFEPPPQGNILAAEAKALARGRMCLEGNIQIHRMYEASPESVRQETRQLMADAFDDGRGLIVSPTASPYIPGAGETCFPQYRAMVETVLAYKR